MSFACARDPVIIVGVPRSGTTLISELLQRLGLFIGHSILADKEAKYFYSVNSQILRSIHAYWDNPSPVRFLVRDSDRVERIVEDLEADLRSFRIANYLGWKNYVKFRSLAQFDMPWGWKDPQNVLTMPIWLRVFPKAKIVYIVRNGVAVANSLVAVQSGLISKRFERNQARVRRLGARSKERIGVKGSSRCLTLEGSFSLWEEYVTHAEEVLKLVNNERRVIKYEEFLSDPAEHLRRLARFCGLEPRASETLHDHLELVDVTKATSFLQTAALVRFHSEVRMSRWMAHYGYDG
jgi:hypothetical protein